MALTEGLTDELRVRVSVACVGRVRSGMDVKDGWMDGIQPIPMPQEREDRSIDKSPRRIEARTCRGCLSFI
jgi:hypothetical protein